MHPFRFGVTATRASSREEWVATARRAEELRYDLFFMPDHTGHQLAPITALQAVADATTRLRIGALVFANDFRHPFMLAKEVATLDLLSGGRVELGLGAGWATRDYERMGIPYEAPGVRIARMLEAIRLMKRLFSGERVDFSGTYYRAKRARLFPSPLQRPYPTLIIGGGGPRILSLAAREADVVSLAPSVNSRGRHRVGEITVSATERKIALIKAAAGERFARLEIQGFVVDAEVGTLAAGAKRLAFATIGTPYFLYGSAKQVRADLLRWRERLGISRYSIPWQAMESFAPIVAELAGR